MITASLSNCTCFISKFSFCLPKLSIYFHINVTMIATLKTTDLLHFNNIIIIVPLLFMSLRMISNILFFIFFLFKVNYMKKYIIMYFKATPLIVLNSHNICLSSQKAVTFLLYVLHVVLIK